MRIVLLLLSAGLIYGLDQPSFAEDTALQNELSQGVTSVLDPVGPPLPAPDVQAKPAVRKSNDANRSEETIFINRFGINSHRVNEFQNGINSSMNSKSILWAGFIMLLFGACAGFVTLRKK